MVIFEIVYKVLLDTDDHWRIVWMFYACWFTLFSGFLFWVMILLRPNEKSKLLMEITQLHDTSFTHRETIEMSEIGEKAASPPKM